MNVSSPRTALKLVTPLPSRSFCSRCGAVSLVSPQTPRGGESRVCAQCGLGLLLRTPMELSAADPFLVVDRALCVSAVSRSAERRIRRSEGEALGQPVSRLVTPAQSAERFAALLSRATLPGGAPRRLRCWIGGDRHELCDVWLGPCGPPPGALLILGES